MLSRIERRALLEIERGLVDSDPALASTLRAPMPPSVPAGVGRAPVTLAAALGLMLVAAVLALPGVALAAAAMAVGTLIVHALARNPDDDAVRAAFHRRPGA